MKQVSLLQRKDGFIVYIQSLHSKISRRIIKRISSEVDQQFLQHQATLKSQRKRIKRERNGNSRDVNSKV